MTNKTFYVVYQIVPLQMPFRGNVSYSDPPQGQ